MPQALSPLPKERDFNPEPLLPGEKGVGDEGRFDSVPKLSSYIHSIGGYPGYPLQTGEISPHKRGD